MEVERYRCPKCDAYVLAADVDEVREVWPPNVEPNDAGFGKVEVIVRPGPIFCHSDAHPHPVNMKRETFKYDTFGLGRGLLRRSERRDDD